MILATLEVEEKLWQKGYRKICGLDEVGRGCFAGPVVVGAVILPQDIVLPEGIADSKLLTPKQRERLSEEIKRVAFAWSVAEISVAHINKLGIGKATQMAFRKAIKNLSVQADFVIIDAFYVKHLSRRKQLPIVHGDRISASIAAASIIAKVYRDKLMQNLHQKYPHYNWSQNKGYGTKDHREAIKRHGLCRLHRKSFNLNKFL